jgi:predicted CoA-binding protein
MVTLQSIQDFLNQKNIALAGISREKRKFGNAIFKELHEKGYNIYPVHPNLDEYMGVKCYHNLESLPKEVTALIINTKNESTVRLLEEADKKGIHHVWLGQGSASKETIEASTKYNGNIISGQCILMHAAPVHGIHGFHRWLKKNFGKFPN